MSGPEPPAGRTVAAALHTVTATLPDSSDRPGQVQMAEAVAHALDSGRHLVVQAGTGTGKSLAYLIPIALADARTVVVTATKALQDQLSTKDLPLLADLLDVDAAVLKGRNNYLCRQRLHELGQQAEGQLDLGEADTVPSADLERLTRWARTSATGDRAELDWAPSDRVWRAVSVGSDECPGARNCPRGDECFAEAARQRAMEAQIVVVNTHLYGQHVASGGEFLPAHDAVVFDEAHVLEDIMSASVGIEIGGGRFAAVTAAVGRVIADDDLTGSLGAASDAVRSVLAPLVGQRLGPPLPEEVQDVLADARIALERAATALKELERTGAGVTEEFTQRRLRAMTMIGRLSEALDTALTAASGTVAFVSGRPESARLEIAPLDVGPALAAVWEGQTAILTSATIPASIVNRLGLPADSVDVIDVGSPFDYDRQALLYCAMDLPDRNAPGFRQAVHDELQVLIEAAGGRTLALFTSWSALDEAVESLRDRLEFRVLSQRDLPQAALIREFTDDESSCLFATAGFFQGVDVPGASLSLVTIDRLPFPRPDDPLLSARREELGRAAFGEIDVPRAATLLAQAAGRLIRSSSDRGVVAVMDRRLATAGYRWNIINALPPMRRTRHRDEAVAFLRSLSE